MDKELIRRIEDLAGQCTRRNREAATMFLDPAELAQAEAAVRKIPGAAVLCHGGFEDAERRRMFFLPDYFEPDTFPIEEHIAAVRITCPYGAPTHRDFLGSVLGLGIKRDALGDILVFQGHTDVICTPQIAAFIADNLTRVGRCGVSCAPLPIGEIIAPTPEFKKVGGTVASPRADAVAALGFNISRTAAAELIRDGRLAVNHLEQLSPSAEISEGDLLSLRGYGRARLAAVGGTSKKGRIFLEIHAFTKK